MYNTGNRIVETPFGKIELIKRLGKGKSGVSFLGFCNGISVVFKEMHYEPCPYYNFSDNKVKLEINAFECLKKCNVPIPELLYHDVENNYLVKSYIDGKCGDLWVGEGNSSHGIIGQLFEIYENVKSHNLNIDYFPANFVISGNKLFYIDYEINPYSYEWGLEEWGIYYWANNDGMNEYVKSGAWNKINVDADSGKPVKAPFEQKVDDWKKLFLRDL